MIARTKVNYSFRDILSAFFVPEKGTVHRDILRGLLSEMFDTVNIHLAPSGRGALLAILRNLPHKVVIVPAYTCKAVVEAVLLAGKRLRHVEVEDDGFNLDAAQLEPMLNSDCVVIATHQFGICCDIDRIRVLCQTSGAYLIEDVAAAFGSRFEGKLTGTFGDAAFFSFDSTKFINVPLKAGFFIIKDPLLFSAVRLSCETFFRSMTFTQKLLLLAKATFMLIIEHPFLYRIFHTFFFDLRGRYTMDGPDLKPTLGPSMVQSFAEWQAMIAGRQLRSLHALIQRRQFMYESYRTKLAGCKSFSLPPIDHAGEWACARFPIRVHGDKIAFYREACKRGVDMAFSFTFIDCPPELLRSKALASSVLDLPFYGKLSDVDLNKTVAVLKDIDK